MGGTSLDLITTLVEARDVGDVDTALRCYAPDATIVTPEGAELSGINAARAALIEFNSLAARFTALRRRIVPGGADIALHYSQWALAGDGPQGPFELTGISTDVIARRPGAGWLLVIDNPYGVEVLRPTED